MYAGTLSYFAQLQAQYKLSALASTVKALQLANAQGQQIYKIDQTNIDTVLPKLNLSNSVKQDIQSSVNAGKYVITYTDNVSVPGWSGAGYAIIDPLTGSDAYMISGGENGGFFDIVGGVQGFQLMIMSIVTDLSTVIAENWSHAPDIFMKNLMTIFNRMFSALGLAFSLLDLYDTCKNQLFVMLNYMVVITIITVLVTFLLATMGLIFAVLMNVFASVINTALMNSAKNMCSGE